MGFPGGSDGKQSACNARDQGSIPGFGRSPGEGNGNPLQYSCLENSMDLSLAGYSPLYQKELDTIGQLTLELINVSELNTLNYNMKAIRGRTFERTRNGNTQSNVSA